MTPFAAFPEGSPEACYTTPCRKQVFVSAEVATKMFSKAFWYCVCCLLSRTGGQRRSSMRPKPLSDWGSAKGPDPITNIVQGQGSLMDLLKANDRQVQTQPTDRCRICIQSENLICPVLEVLCVAGQAALHTDKKFTHTPALLPTAARQKDKQLPSLTFSNTSVMYSPQIPLQFLISCVYNCEVVPTRTTENQTESTEHLPSKGVGITPHHVVLGAEPSCVGVMHKEDSSEGISQTDKLDLNKWIALAEIDCPLALNWAYETRQLQSAEMSQPSVFLSSRHNHRCQSLTPWHCDLGGSETHTSWFSLELETMSLRWESVFIKEAAVRRAWQVSTSSKSCVC